MPSNLSADERAAVEKVRDALDFCGATASSIMHDGAGDPYYKPDANDPETLNFITAADLRTLLAVVARAGEPVAWVVEFKRDDESEWRKSGPHLDYAEAERDQTRLLLRHWPAHILSLYAHPADARDRGDASEAVMHAIAETVTRCAGLVMAKVPTEEWCINYAEILRTAIDHAMHAAPAAPEDK